MSSVVEMQYQQHLPQQQYESPPLSLELVQKQLDDIEDQQKSEQQSYLAAVSGNNYASQRETRRRPKKKKKKKKNVQQIRRHMQPAAMQAYRQLVGAATNNYGPGSYTSYGSSPSGGEYPPSNVGYSSYYPSAQGTGYGDSSQHPTHPQQHQSHPPVYGPPPQSHPPPPPLPPPPINHSKPPTKGGGKNKKGDATLTALTLLSFFFFVNLLQSCLKEHMTTMNPTVMVMTVNGVRNRFNKLAEMNSREQNIASAASASSNSMVAAADVGPSIMLEQSPLSKKVKNNNPNNNALPTHNYNNNNNNNNDNINNAYSYEPEEHGIKNNGANQSARPQLYDTVHSYSRHRNNSASDSSYPDGNVFSDTYIRSKSANKLHNYSSHQKGMSADESHGVWDRDIDRHLRPSQYENSYVSSLRGTSAVPTNYWTLAARTSNAADLFHDTDDIEGRYINGSETRDVDI